MSRLARLVIVLALLVALQPLHAQPAFLVKDIQEGEEMIPWFGNRNTSVELGGVVYLNVDDGVHGAELWRSDGTEAGTRMVADLCSGICSSNPTDLTVAGGVLYFLANDGFHGPALWKSDGTEEGTAPIKGLELRTDLQLTVAGNLLFFAAATEDTGTELWRTDGTPAGTIPLGDLYAGTGGSNPILLGAVGATCFFSAVDLSHGRELWKSDGTPAGTVLVKDLNPGSDSSLYLITQWPQRIYPEVGGRLVFPASDNVGHGLWASDGTAAGTQKISTVSPSPQVSFTKMGEQAFSTAIPRLTDSSCGRRTAPRPARPSSRTSTRPAARPPRS